VKRQLIIGCLTAALLAACATQQGRNELPSSSPLANRIQTALNETVISEIEIQDMPLEKAAKEWQRASLKSRHQQFNFRYAISHPMVFSSRPAGPGGVQNSAATSTLSSARITVRRKNITSERLLDEICQQANYSWIIMGRVIVLRPGAASSATQP